MEEDMFNRNTNGARVTDWRFIAGHKMFVDEASVAHAKTTQPQNGGF